MVTPSVSVTKILERKLEEEKMFGVRGFGGWGRIWSVVTQPCVFRQNITEEG